MTRQRKDAGENAWSTWPDLWSRPLACALISLVAPAAARAVIVDRIAVAAGEKIITASEIDLRIRLTAFQNREKADVGLASRRRAAEELIDQKLIEREMDVGHYPRLDVIGRKALLTDYEKAEYKSDPVSLAKALAVYGLTTEDLEDDLGRQSDLLTFLNLRFRPAVQVTDQDVQKYFDENAPKGGRLNEMRAVIEQKLTNARADKELDLWLADQRKRTRIEYLEKDLQEDQGNKK
jgi:antitoxin component HigA of HigAB toxin-antitoxin module